MSRRGKGETNYDLQIADVLPLVALDERVAIVSTTGVGKTYAAKSRVKRLLEAGAQVCVVDPLGVWRTVLDLRDQVATELPKGFGR